LVCAAAAVALLCPATASALVKFDFEQRYHHENPTGVLDHSIVEVDGVYHLFYLRGNPAVDIGHATTIDFVDWQFEEPVLSPGDWDGVMWAPMLLPVPGFGWYMYYTGVNTIGAQQTGMAISSDLEVWHKIPWPIYHPDPVWALWDETQWSHGRDPHVIEYNGKFYMFVTAKTIAGLGAVACAESDDGISWTDIGPIYVHDTWHVFESVFILQRNGKFHMFFTEEEVYGTSHMASDDLFSGWDIGTRIIIDTGHAPEITQLSDGREMFSRHAVYNNNFDENFHVHRIDELAWAGDIPAPHKPWAIADDWNLIWGNAFAYQPVFRNNLKARGQNVPNTFEGNCWLGTYERYTGPLGFGTPGGFQGDSRTGVIRSNSFVIEGNSMNLLVGGGNDIDLLYVALVDATTAEVLFKETGLDTEEMDRRYWDLAPHDGREVYVEIADLSTVAWGHINCDDITESWDIIGPGDDDQGDGGTKGLRGTGVLNRTDEHGESPAGKAFLMQNSPNPFNPNTRIVYEVPGTGRVTLRVYDVKGKLVRNLVDGEQEAGPHAITWNGRDETGRRAVTGVYLYRLTFAGEIVDTKKMLMLK
jgi:hypothetical protein